MKMLAAAAVAAAMVLAGCATAPEPGPNPAAQEVAALDGTNTAGTGGHQMTGSRLKRDSTERMLKAVGGQSVRDEIDKAPRPLLTQ